MPAPLSIWNTLPPTKNPVTGANWLFSWTISLHLQQKYTPCDLSLDIQKKYSKQGEWQVFCWYAFAGPDIPNFSCLDVMYTLQGTNKSQIGKRKLIFKILQSILGGDMLVPQEGRVCWSICQYVWWLPRSQLSNPTSPLSSCFDSRQNTASQKGDLGPVSLNSSLPPKKKGSWHDIDQTRAIHEFFLAEITLKIIIHAHVVFVPFNFYQSWVVWIQIQSPLRRTKKNATAFWVRNWFWKELYILRRCFNNHDPRNLSLRKHYRNIRLCFEGYPVAPLDLMNGYPKLPQFWRKYLENLGNDHYFRQLDCWF